MKALSAATVKMVVFSCNRGHYLRNCIASIERHLPGAEVVIVDDRSDCPATIMTLEDLGRRYKIISAGEKVNDIYLGGLHKNMNAALDESIARGVEYLFFVQDDQQFVRRCEGDFFERCLRIFGHDPRIVQIGPMFFKGYVPKDYYNNEYSFVPDPGFYAVDRGIADVGILHVPRIRDFGFRYADTEGQSGRGALDLGIKLAIHRDPVLMYTPWPRTIRKRSRGGWLLSRVNEMGIGAGCHPFHDMTEAEISNLLKRPIEEFPIAEFFLRTRSRAKLPWYYSDLLDTSNLWDFKKFIKLRWLFGCPPEYVNKVKMIDAESLNRMRRYASAARR